MKSCKVRLEEIADPANLREAFLRAAKGKSHKRDAMAFRSELDRELAMLRCEILQGEVRVGQTTEFTIWEPKERRIHAPCFCERVLHHALLRPCEADFERWLIGDTYACRRGLGRDAALRRAEQYARRHRWFLKLDVAKYFDSIPHGVLLGEVGRRFRDRRVVALWARIVRAYECGPGRGLPIGALTSQHLANFYLGAVDRFVKETLRVRGYVRYMDDMALWSDDRWELRRARIALEEFVIRRLELRLRSNVHLQPTARGMDFLGYRVRPGGSVLARASRRRFIRRWLGIERDLASGRMGEATAQRSLLAMTAFVRAASDEGILPRLFSGTGHRAPTASTAAAVGTTRLTTAAPPTATGTSRATATGTSASASPSAHGCRSGWIGEALNRPVSSSRDRAGRTQQRAARCW
ncbi:MAG: RNA-directed DNA polymerase [Verrucomicrobia bacterium]|nr:RNA-directed DNA polymerase [Verrucomicrobiota bacterium]